MSEKNGKFVTLRTKGNKEGLEAEPEMIELLGMVQSGQLDRNRIVSYMNPEGEPYEKGDPKLCPMGWGLFCRFEKMLIPKIQYEIKKPS